MGVQLNIKSAKARRLAEELSVATGKSITDVVTSALDQSVRDLSKDQRRSELDTLLKGSRARWKPSLIGMEHGDMLYDETGLPG